MTPLRLVALPLCVLLLSGCAASRGGGSLGALLVKQGEPAVDLGGPKPGPPDQRPSTPPAAAVSPPPQAPPQSPLAGGVTLESSDPGLAVALLAARMVPTPGNEVQVAREYVRAGILDAAFTHATKALEIDPRFSPAHEIIARLWRDWGLPANGLGPAWRAVYFAPGSAAAENTLGTILDRLGRRDEARVAYDRALALDPAAAWTLSNACYSEFRSGRLAEARARCEAALAIDPAMAAAHNNLALALAAGGDLVRASEQFRAAGDTAAAEYNLGIVFMAGGQYAAAADRFERAVAARPGFVDAGVRARDARRRALAVRQ